MNPREQQQVQLIFEQLIDLAAAERAPYLDRHCGAGSPVRKALEGLMAEHELQSGLLDRPLFSAALLPEEDVWTGRVVHSRYRIERFLARGGMSAVYLAHDEQLAGRPVVVKFLHGWAPQYAGLKARFRQEMEALARIDHRGVVGVLDAGETADGLPFLVVEYIDGVTLRSELERGPMPAQRVAALIRQIARAVSAAHAKGVLHRDLKPENIMLERPGEPEEFVRLIDFGIARLEQTEGGLATRTTQFAGTTPYMAPEQMRGKPSAASDTYAMAVVAYEMLAGQRPFPGAGPIEIYEQQRSGASLKPLIDRGIPELAARLIARQLSFRVEDRGASAVEAAEAMADALLHPKHYLWSRRNVMLGITGAGLAGMGGGWFWWTHPDPLSEAERVIELPLPSEPLEQGFRATGTIDNRIVRNSERTGYEALRLISTDQGGYYRQLNRRQAAAAKRMGWRMIFDAAAEEGEIYVNVHMQSLPVRYSVDITCSAGGPDIVRLATAINPVITGVQFPLPGPRGARHQYMLVLQRPDAGADLWIDGVKYYSGYRGLSQYLYERGPEIGVAQYRSSRGAGVFWKFRFEIG
jgi:serine/threonine-protein kinase